MLELMFRYVFPARVCVGVVEEEMVLGAGWHAKRRAAALPPFYGGRAGAGGRESI
jgi:hypothetical protein